MEDEIKTWLTDIKQAIIEISDFLPNKRDFIQFKKDLKTKRAIERNVEIIGEAANRIFKRPPGIEITDIGKIIATRNRIIHGYDSVSDDVIWTVVVKYLPNLFDEINKLLE